ncbi:DegV family protein [Acidaminobacter sp.]|uniref:DegV family protein n=1 Tax=Acidaminobacter sp. TaxID=1872102 RepID=UPI002562702C|nr:DegV family protein [Acidaminobacter sp.]MDK9710756.1 DegV family EDD domain-containing protein [Acidaminobacter sp.]
MTANSINGRHVYYAILAGANEVIQNKSELDRINVFPVPDGDTGANLTSTMKAVMENLRLENEVDLVLSSAADGALMGARGNSGLIFAQLIYGWYMEVKSKETLTQDELIHSLQGALKRLYGVMLNPVEGTILTVVREWIHSLEKHKDKAATILEYAERTLSDSGVALKKTTEMLEQLRKSNVVDAGAKGFYHFLEGIKRYIEHGEAGIERISVIPTEAHPRSAEAHETLGEFRYCCETLLTRREKGKDKGMNVEEIREIAARYGDSLVIAGGEDKLRVHLHTNSPEPMFDALSRVGQLDAIKVDDMKIQVDIRNHRKYPFAIVTDTIADLPQSFIDEHQISVIPLQLEIGGVVHLDRVTVSVGHFYELNKTLKDQPQSSLPAIKNVENLLMFLSDYYEAILVLSVSDKLSGTYGMIKGLEPVVEKRGRKIEVLNTLKNSGAQGLMVKKAVDMAKEGRSFEEVVEIMRAMRDRVKILVSVDTVKYLERSGRVSRSVGKVAKVIGLKPLMTLDREGHGKAYGGKLTFNAVMKKLVKSVSADIEKYGLEEYVIVHAACLDRAMELARIFEELTGKPPEFIAEISPVVGATAGEGATAIAYLQEKAGW